ncbi:hypothetical protein [Flavihumibacter solisilvae]|uniref:Uncharacterized protein n=1 Tax=Flavihumibacter solisilvae TaxID=1349421 RepID=A0A0C1IFX4_9BACT|nr:hypothetical protein [Flavihumibacter solisilvae]KIC93035.1 hypothetical protein OI18_20030 [Flavihumibacter solisilvae]
MEILKHISALILFVLPFMLYGLTVSAYEANVSQHAKRTGAIACSPSATDDENELPHQSDKAGCHVGMLMITCESCRPSKK